MKRLALLCVLLTGCGRYADFSLPGPKPAGEWGTAWEARPLPVIPREDAVDVLNPSVVRFHGQYWNFYSEYDGKQWHTSAASSPDGIRWAKLGRVLSPPADGYIAANGSALVVGDEIFYWYETGYPLRLALARSSDGRTFRTVGEVLSTGPYRSFDEIAVADPYVIQADGYFYMYYLGQDRAERQRLGLARSKDGMVWEKLRSNPVMEGGPPGSFDEELGEPAVFTTGRFWWMLYTGRARDEQRKIGLARSSDGVQWTRIPEVVIGGQGWSGKVMADPTVEVLDNEVRVWFGGGDVASPDQNLHGQIGLGSLRPR